MKLLFCNQCYDIRKLQYHLVRCQCGQVTAHYLEDGINAVFSGNGRLIGISGPSFAEALKKPNRPDGLGNQFIAFTIPDNASSVRKIK